MRQTSLPVGQGVYLREVKMLHIGCHLSISKGFLHIGKEAASLGADTFQFFTRNPQGGKAKEINSEDNKFQQSQRRTGNYPVK